MKILMNQQIPRTELPRLGSTSLFRRLNLPQECCFHSIIALGNYEAAAPDWKQHPVSVS